MQAPSPTSGVLVSLFENSEYEYRDTFFVFFDPENRPSSDKVEACIAELGSKYEMENAKSDDGDFESITVKSPYDFSAMDIAYVEGEEVTGQVQELMEEFKTMTLVGDDHKKLGKFKNASARFDIYHFEQVKGESQDFLDPGGLLIVLEKLTDLCDGVGLDPQSHTLM